jgi:1-phosphofructokinase family hexose kinase
MRLCVVSLNPALDAEWRVENVLWEEKNVVAAQRRWPGGKGVNVARWLRLLKVPSEILLPLGGPAGREMKVGLRELELSVRAIPILCETRTNVVVTTANGRQLRFNPPGPKITPIERQAIFAGVQRSLRAGASLILSGALPPGLKPDTYARLVRLAKEAGRKAFVDCDGAALVAAVKARPFLLKPNEHELSRWAGTELGSQTAVRNAATEMSRQSGGWVLVSQGEKGGMLVNAAERFQAEAAAPRLRVLNTVGAGDAMLAAAAAAIENRAEPSAWLRQGIAAGCAVTQCAAGEWPRLSVVREIARRVVLKRLA